MPRPPHRRAVAASHPPKWADVAVAADSFPRGVWLTRLAFGLLLAIVIARLTMLEAIRTGTPPGPGSPAAPAGPGPTTGLVLDLLACVPALLVLARRRVDPTFTLRLTASMVPLGLLATWAALSPLWANDRFAARVSSTHLVAAFAALWAASQVVRRWAHVRVVAGVCLGVLLVLIAHGAYYVAVEQPELRQMWAASGEEILRQRGIQPGSFDAIQFENKVLRGELMGFYASPNTYAAVIVLTLIVAAGAVIDRLRHLAPSSPAEPGSADDAPAPGDGVVLWYQRVRAPRSDGRGPMTTVAVVTIAAAVCALAAAWAVVKSGSRTAYLTPVLAAGMLVAIAVGRRWLARHAGLAFFAALAGVAAVTAAVVGHGLYHGTLFHDSLNFRWRYWVGSAKLFALHPLAGVGWENFGPYYLGTRLTTATEEIRDPHNFVVRFFVELGLVGGLLLLAWLGRLAWEVTRPVVAPLASVPNAAGGTDGADGHDGHGSTESPDVPTGGWAAVLGLLAVIAAGFVVNVAASLDFDHGGAYTVVELFRRAVSFVALGVGTAVVALYGRPTVALDDRPAPWTLYALLVGLGVFLLHNLIDFSMFEVGPLFLFALLAGTALGMRTPAGPVRAGGRRIAAGVLGSAVVALFVVALDVAAPVAAAESTAAAGDDVARRGRMADAAALYERAFGRLPTNADYAFRAAGAWHAAARAERQAATDDRTANREPQAVARTARADELDAAARRMVDAAVAAEPQSAGYRIARASFELARPAPDLERVRDDYAAAVRLDPNHLGNRLQYAGVLEKLNRLTEARREYEKALWYNDQLTREEKKRLPEDRVAEIRRKIATLPAQ